jgi:hypothetical protein
LWIHTFPPQSAFTSLPAIDCYSKREEIPLSETTTCAPFVHFSAKPVIGRAFARSAGNDDKNPTLPA